MPLFLATPASADDIADATTALDSGNALVVDLTIQNDQATAIVTSSEEQVLAAQASLDSSTQVLLSASQDVADAQTAYDTQLITSVTYTDSGLTATVYNDRGYNGSPPVGAGTIVGTQTVAQINFQWGGGSVLGGPSEDVQIKFEGTITTPETKEYSFYGPADDGFILKINGNTIINDWVDKGGGGTISSPVLLVAGQANRFEAWYYENGGGAWVQLNWYDNGWRVVPATAFDVPHVVQTQDPNLLLVLNDAVSSLEVAQTDQDEALATLNAAISLYNEALSAKEVVYANLQAAIAAIPTLQQNLADVIEAQRLADEAARVAEQARLDAIAAQEAAERAAAEAKAIQEARAKAEAEALAAEQARLAEEARIAAEKAAAEAAQAEEDARIAAELAAADALAAQLAAEAAQAELDRLAAEEANKPEEIIIEPEAIPEQEVKVEETKLDELSSIEPEDLTDAQVEQLVTAAEAVLATAEQGSPAYEQALEALAIAAVADDPQLPAELAAIPGAAAVLETFNALGNIGADMAPAVREEAEKTVIASVIAAGAAVNATVTAATTSSSTGSGGSSGSSGSSAESKTSARRREE